MMNPFTKTTAETLEHYRMMLAQALDWAAFWGKCEREADEARGCCLIHVQIQERSLKALK